MADNHLETILNLLKLWQTLVNQEHEAISQENIQDLEKLIKRSFLIQQRLEHLLGASVSTRHDKLVSEMIRDLYKKQEKVMAELQGKTDELAREIGTLRKNKTSLMGYKQKKTLAPRFKSERT